MFSLAHLLLVLCGALTPALCCDWLTNYGHLRNSSLKLLQQMGGQLTVEDSPVPFPYDMYDQIRHAEVESQLVFIRDSLKLILELYHHVNSSVAWDTAKLDNFRAKIYRQEQEVSRCVTTDRRADSSLRNYYRQLRWRTLHHMGGSSASWELIRKETKLHLQQLELLANSMKTAAGH